MSLTSSPDVVSRCPHCSAPLRRPGARFCGKCGRALAAEPAEPELHEETAEPTRPARTTPSARRSLGLGRLGWVRRVPVRWRITALIAVVVLGVGGWLWVGQTVISPPDQPVRELFAAMQARDGARIADLVGGAGNPMLAATALQAGYEPPTEVEIGAVTAGTALDQTRRPNKSVAFVAVKYRVAGQLVETSVEVVRESTGPVRSWSLGDGSLIPFVVISKQTKRARVGGATVSTVTDVPVSSSSALHGLPGVYTVRAAAGDPLFESSPVTLALVSRTGIARAELAAVVAPSVRAAIDAQVRELLDNCAKQTDEMLVGCPFSLIRLGHRLDNVQWRIAKYPQLDYGLSSKPILDGGPVVFKTTAKGKAVITFTENGSAGTDAVEFGVVGAVDLDAAGKPVVATFGGDD